MKKILLAASALSLLAAPAFAQTANASVTLNGNIGEACGVTGALLTNNTFPVNMPIDSNGRLALAPTFGDNPIATAQQLFGNGEIWCNASARITVTGTPMLHTSLPLQNNHARPAAGEFTGIVDLNLRIDATNGFKIGNVQFPAGRLNTGAGLDVGGGGNVSGVAHVDSAGAFAGQMEGTMFLYGGEPRRLLAGDYRSQWTITVAPN